MLLVGPENDRVLSSPTLLICLLASVLGAQPASAAAGPVELSGRIEGLGVARFDDDTPRQRPLARLDLSATQKWTDQLRWKLSAVGRIGGPPFGARTGAFDFDRTFQNYSPSLELGEAWIDFTTEHAAVRLGTQKFFWGILDVIQPNDQLNPREYEDPFLVSEKDRKIAVPAVSIELFAPSPPASWHTSDLQFSLVWQPIAVPWRFPLPGERWFAPAARAPDTIFVGAIDGTPCPCDLPVDQVARNSDAPARRFDNGNVGVRLGGRSGIVDWHLMFFDGYDTAPAFDTTARVNDPIEDPSVETELLPAYLRYTSVGADAATTVGDWSVRAEGAYKFGRPWSFELSRLTDQVVNDPDAVDALLDGETLMLPTYVKRDAIEWGLAADTFFADTLALVEFYQVLLFNNDVPLLVRNVDTRLAVNLETPWFGERLTTELLGVWGIEAGYALTRAHASWAWTDALRLELGLLGIWGDQDSLVGQYERNSQLYGRVTYSF
ncbi:MAG: hypothetical protein P8R42_30375 [Candidatus Binatia bacterium]|nr:hypothetical protein [Candidatus Binatia bacterium]